MSELTGAELDLAVGKALRIVAHIHETHDERFCVTSLDHEMYRPSIYWAQGGPLIEEYRIYVGGGGDKDWIAVTVNKHVRYVSSGPTPLIAVCRAIVASVEEKNND